MSIKKNIVYNVGLSVANLLFPLVTSPYIYRVLGVENIGLVNFAMSYANYFVLFAALGTGLYGIREIAKYKDNQEQASQLFSEIFRINLITTFIVSLIYFASVFYIPELRQDWHLFIVAGISVYLVPIAIDWYFQGLEEFKMIACRSFIIKCVSFAGLFIFVRQREDVMPYLMLFILSTLGTNVWNLIYAKKKGLKIKWRNLNVKVHIKPMLVFFASNIAASIFVALNVLMLGFLSTYEQVGLFTSSNKITDFAMLAFFAINAVLLPRVAFNKKQNDHLANANLLQKVFDTNALLIMPVAIGLYLVSARFIPLFFGNEFTGSIVPMQILSFKVIAAMINSFFTTSVLAALGHENKFLIVVCLTATVSFILNWIFIPLYGAVGAAITIIISETTEIFLNLFFVYKFTNIRIKWHVLWQSFLFALPIFLLYFLFNPLIANDILFLSIFAGTSVLLYLISQIYLAKNQLMIHIIDLIKVRLNTKNNR
ncbi:heteropolysaccharide repeat-containing protein [Bacteroidia bacterium]|nr:heteropolysaccharide repeat-containing protein [Bacteroidia bacterium]